MAICSTTRLAARSFRYSFHHQEGFVLVGAEVKSTEYAGLVEVPGFLGLRPQDLVRELILSDTWNRFFRRRRFSCVTPLISSFSSSKSKLSPDLDGWNQNGPQPATESRSRFPQRSQFLLQFVAAGLGQFVAHQRFQQD